MASSTSVDEITLRFSLAVKRAASFKTFAKSAPVNPGVLLAIAKRSRSFSKGLFLE